MKKRVYYLILIASVVGVCLNTGYYLNIAISNTYEVIQPRMMLGDSEHIRERESILKRQRYVSVGLYVLIITAIGISIYQVSRKP